MIKGADRAWGLTAAQACVTLDRSAMDEAHILLDLAEQLAGVGHWRISLPEHTITWSNEVYRIHGVSRVDYVPDLQTAIGFYHPDDQGAVRAAVNKAERDGTPFEFAARLIRPDGTLRHVRSRGIVLSGPEMAPVLIFGVFIDVTDQCRVEEALRETNLTLEQIAYVDGLTGVANRRQFDEVLLREWRRASRESSPLSLIMLDIDRFKLFNDHYGHLAGDACLRAVAAVLAPVARRGGDLIARYGGEEFALILPDTDAAGAETVAQAARAAIERLQMGHLGNTSCGQVVTASLGVATAFPKLGSAPFPWNELIAEADGLLYEAKRCGRNRVASRASLGPPGAAPRAVDEEARLATLAVYEQNGATARTAEMDHIAELAATLTASPIALISLVGRDQQYFAGNYGLTGVDATSRDVSFCAYTIMGDEPLVVADAAGDPRFKDNPLVTGDLNLRYYAGAPIVSSATGHRLGAVCVIGTSPRPTTDPSQRDLLTELAQMAANVLDRQLNAAP